jgi:hypothetical protein
MNLDEAQKHKVRQWIEEGQKLSGIQKRLEQDFGLKMTYLEARLLVDDLKLSPKDPTPPPKPATPVEPPAAEKTSPADAETDLSDAVPAGAGKVTISVDTLPRSGSLISGGVTFSDGNTATWMLDQMGRLGLGAKTPGYRPSPQDVEEFQLLLQAELGKLGA